MSKTNSSQLSLDSLGESHDAPRGVVDEQPWDHEWQNYDPDREPGDETPDGVLLRRKKQQVARERNISFSEADHLIRTGEVEVPDEEVV